MMIIIITKKSKRGSTFFVTYVSIHKGNNNVAWPAAF